MEKYYAGIDLGTSGCRLNVINSHKKLIKECSINYADVTQQNPELWWDTVVALFNQLDSELKKQLLAIAVDGTSGSILLVDKEGRQSSSVLMYNDLRATEEADYLKTVLPENNGGQGVSTSLARLLWLLKHEPSEQHAHVVHQADFILGKLSNNYSISDENNCLKLGYDVLNQAWQEELLSLLGDKSTLLPRVYPAGTPVAQIDPRQAQQLGLSDSLQCVTGTTDSIAAFIATGASLKGDAVTSLGSTLVVKLISDTPVFSNKHGIYSHRLNDLWLVGGASNSGARVLRHFFTQQQLDAMTLQLNPQQSTGLDYYPLSDKGERFPIADVDKAPKLTPRPASDLLFFQGILESIANIERQAYQILAELGAPQLASVYTVGGGASNKAWTQIRKKCLNAEMKEAHYTEAAYGAALLAFKGLRG